ncbi:TIGR01777 family oxidoreductase [Apibacter raozihei]|uniref:TIGR01777 family oxidoreductase n=1 Tax=Apibacter raozihei TaxID=2500547 RepID=UPI000FE33322|nr:TIGR01777 family oxidoreductase [Apibacter raozihei]
MKKTILITGANGGVAQHLSSLLKENYNLRYLTRNKKKENEFEWDLVNKKLDIRALQGVNNIIHLAGAGIADKRWSQERKKVILSSRIESAQLLLESLKKHSLHIDSFISASAVGYYGMKTSDKIYNEMDKPGDDFLSDVCIQWEQAADNFLLENVADRVAKVRLGVVLSDSPKGVMEIIKKTIKYYVGANLGSGKQYMPWIHIDDLCNIFKEAVINTEISGTYNAVAPEPTTNKGFTHLLADMMDKPLIMPNIPGFLIKLALGESAGMILEGSRVSCDKLLQSGYKFKYPQLREALQSLL